MQSHTRKKRTRFSLELSNLHLREMRFAFIEFVLAVVFRRRSILERVVLLAYKNLGAKEF